MLSSPSAAREFAPSLVASIPSLLLHLGVDPAEGLSEGEVTCRLRAQGANTLPESQPSLWVHQVVAQCRHPLVLMLLGGACVATWQGAGQHAALPWLARYGDALAILVIVLLNAGLGVVQERKALSMLRSLRRLQQPWAHVLRAGRAYTVPAAELVVGDILVLEAGDAVPADARLLEAVALATREANLTGESTSTHKQVLLEEPLHLPLAERVGSVFVGTEVVQGRGRAVVVATGTATALGAISRMLTHEANAPQARLQVQIDRFGTQMLWFCLGLGALVCAHGAWTARQPWPSLLLEAVSLAVAVLPEGLPVLTAITLAVGIQRMAKRGVLVSRSTALDSLGAVTILCSDKTGTLTYNAMTVCEVVTCESIQGTVYTVSGSGYSTEGHRLTCNGVPVEIPSPPLHALLTNAILCNHAEFVSAEVPRGDPTEIALHVLARKAGMAAPSKFTWLGELPFDSDRRRMTVLVEGGEPKGWIAHSKGALEEILRFCSTYAGAQGATPLDSSMREALIRHGEAMSHLGLRVLAFASREGLSPANVVLEVDRSLPLSLEQAFCFLGLVGMVDPPRVDAHASLHALQSAGVRTVLLTGDHPSTARALAQQVGLWDPHSRMLTGAELDRMSEAELAACLPTVQIVARVTAAQKVRLVTQFQRQGHTVAMMGDGVNDAPALRAADVGIALQEGTDVARDAADLVVADDPFAAGVYALHEGRALRRNLQKALTFLLASNAGLLLTVLIGPFLPGYLPLTPLMILWINLVTNGLPALALGIDPPDPRTQEAEGHDLSLLGKGASVHLLGAGLYLGAVALLGSSVALPGAERRTWVFAVLMLTPLFYAFHCRSLTRSLLKTQPRIAPWLLGAVGSSAFLQSLPFLIPSWRVVFHTTLLTSSQWGLAVLLSAGVLPLLELFKKAQRGMCASTRVCVVGDSSRGSCP